MKKTIIIIIVVILVILAAYLLLAKKSEAPDMSSADLAKNSSAGSSSGIKEGLLSLMQGTTGVKCTVTDENGTYTVLTKGGKARIEGMNYPDPQDPNKMTKGNMINDGTFVYNWSGQAGTKFNVSEMQDTADTQDNQSASDADWEAWAKNMDESGAKYDCQPGMATDSDFVPPNDVTFQDLSQMFQNFQQLQTNPESFDPSQFQVTE